VNLGIKLEGLEELDLTELKELSVISVLNTRFPVLLVLSY
jgi:hypothetical protein